MAHQPQAQEQQRITQMIEAIGDTPSGTLAVRALRGRGYRVRFGQPLGGAAFTYPWKVITVRRGYPEETTLGLLIHELGHVAFLSNYGRLWSASVEQELAANRFWAQVSRELGKLPAHLEAKWLGPNRDVETLIEEIRRYSTWHQVALPTNQHTGFQDKAWAMWQALASVGWVISALLSWRRRRPELLRQDRDPASGGNATI